MDWTNRSHLVEIGREAVFGSAFAESGERGRPPAVAFAIWLAEDKCGQDPLRAALGLIVFPSVRLLAAVHGMNPNFCRSLDHDAQNFKLKATMASGFMRH